MKKRRGRRRRALEAAAEYFDLPSEVAAGDTRLTLTGSRRLLIENHRGILEYTASLIRVDCGGFSAAVRGGGLMLGAMNARELLVTGDISEIELGGDER